MPCRWARLEGRNASSHQLTRPGLDAVRELDRRGDLDALEQHNVVVAILANLDSYFGLQLCSDRDL